MLSLRHSGICVNGDLTRRDPKYGTDVLMPERDEREAFLPEAVEEQAAHRDHADACASYDQKAGAGKRLAHPHGRVSVGPVDLYKARQLRKLQQKNAKKGATEHASASAQLSGSQM
jgi:hypothetical protein